MINVAQHVVVSHETERVVQWRQHDPCINVQQHDPPTIQVLTVGVQGPVGTVAENVLQRAAQAEQSAQQATLVAEQAVNDLSLLADQLSQSLTFYSGAISAIEES